MLAPLNDERSSVPEHEVVQATRDGKAAGCSTQERAA